MDRGSLIAVFDIGSASVGGLLFSSRKNYSPEVIYSVRETMNLTGKTGKIDFTKNWSAAARKLADVSRLLKKNCAQTPSAAICVFSSPWYVAQTRVAKIERDNPFEINQVLIKDLIFDEAEMFKRQWHKETFGSRAQKSFVEHVPIKTNLNGYVIEHPLGKKAGILELYIYLSLTYKLLKDKIRKEILSHFDAENIYFHTFPFVLFKVLKNLLNTDEGGVFIDITGEITDVFVLRDAIIEEMHSFPCGENFFIKSVAKTFKLDMDEARARLAQYQKGELEKKYSAGLEEVLKKSASEWAGYFKELLEKTTSSKILPPDLYFCGSKTVASFGELTKAVSGTDFSSYTRFHKPFNARFLTPESLKHRFDFAGGSSAGRDIFLLLEAIFADNFIASRANY